MPRLRGHSRPMAPGSALGEGWCGGCLGGRLMVGWKTPNLSLFPMEQSHAGAHSLPLWLVGAGAAAPILEP